MRPPGVLGGPSPDERGPEDVLAENALPHEGVALGEHVHLRARGGLLLVGNVVGVGEPSNMTAFQ